MYMYKSRAQLRHAFVHLRMRSVHSSLFPYSKPLKKKIGQDRGYRLAVLYITTILLSAIDMAVIYH